LLRLTNLSAQDTWKLVEELFESKKDNEQMKKQVKLDKSRMARRELADSKEQIQVEVSFLQGLIESRENFLDRSKAFNALSMIVWEHREGQLKEELDQLETRQQQARQALAEFEPSARIERSRFPSKLKEFRDFCDVRAKRNFTLCPSCQETSDQDVVLQINEKKAEELKVLGLFTEIQAWLNQLAPKMDRNVDKENEMQYHEYLISLMQLKTSGSNQYPELLELIKETISENEEENKIYQKYRDVQKCLPSTLQLEQANIEGFQEAFETFENHAVKFCENTEKLYRNLMDSKKKELEIDRRICEIQMKIEKLAPLSGVSMVSCFIKIYVINTVP
jgi:hypothetical protein